MESLKYDPDVVVDLAKQWLETPYKHQLSKRGVGCDCLGLVRGLWRDLYMADEPEPCPSYSKNWVATSPHETLLNAAQRNLIPSGGDVGDIVLLKWRNNLPARHVAIIVAPGRIIHAYENAGAVVESNFVNWWQRRVAGYFAFPAKIHIDSKG